MGAKDFYTAQATMSGIDTYYAAGDAYEAYQTGELGAEEIVNLGLAATGTVLSTGAAIGSARGLYKLMGSDGVGCKAVTGITGEPHCFVAGTMVSTEDGQKAIEEVETGDRVWAYDEETGDVLVHNKCANPSGSDGKAKTPNYIKENRVPLDKETILSNNKYQKTKMRVKGAQVYKSGDRFYYRDTFHSGESAHLEVFGKKGNHLGEANPLTGELIAGTADSTKKINIK